MSLHLDTLCWFRDNQPLFFTFLLAIVLSVLLRYTDSDYPFGIFTLFLGRRREILSIIANCFFWTIYYNHYADSETTNLCPCSLLLRAYLYPTIYRTRREHPNRYTTDTVCHRRECLTPTCSPLMMTWQQQSYSIFIVEARSNKEQGQRLVVSESA
jgi:hypothetical protein